MAYTREQFIEKYGPYISKITKGTGVLPGTVIAQAIIESSGNYNNQFLVGGSLLSREANNYFGVKCHSSWTGNKYFIDTREYSADRGYYTVNACFRKYNSVEDSLKNHIEFLQQNPRYAQAGVFNAKTVAEQAEALQRAGYATSPTYASKLTQIYNSVKDYVDKYQKYGAKAIVKSFVNSPIAFIKRNPAPVALTIVLIGLTTTYFILNNTSKK
jgi:flagellum-specific peptidoglycan hydrolase FlgJ